MIVMRLYKMNVRHFVNTWAGALELDFGQQALNGAYSLKV